MRARGFTLLELVLVLLLAGLLAALVAPSVSRTLESSRLRGGAAQLRATFSAARAMSTSAGKERSVVVDIEAGEYGVVGEVGRRVLPDGISIRSIRVGGAIVDGGRASGGSPVARVRFFPDGSAEEAELVLSSTGGGTATVAVDPLTGIAEARP